MKIKQTRRAKQSSSWWKEYFQQEIICHHSKQIHIDTLKQTRNQFCPQDRGGEGGRKWRQVSTEKRKNFQYRNKKIDEHREGRELSQEISKIKQPRSKMCTDLLHLELLTLFWQACVTQGIYTISCKNMRFFSPELKLEGLEPLFSVPLASWPRHQACFPRLPHLSLSRTCFFTDHGLCWAGFWTCWIGQIT